MRIRDILIVLSFSLGIFSQEAKAQLKANGYFSFQYENGESQAEFPDGTFRQVQAGLLFAGELNKMFLYDLEVRFKNETRVEIEEAWVAIRPSSAFQLRLGCYLVPFGKYNRASRPHEIDFVKAPLHLEALYPASWRDIGLLAEGSISFFNYSGYLGNGMREAQDVPSGQQFKDNNKDKAIGGRAGVFLSQSFEVGFSYYRGKYDDEGSRSLVLQGADVTWQTDSFLFFYEHGKALIDNPGEYDRGETEGHFFLFSLRTNKFAPLISYQVMKSDDPYHGPGYLAGGIAGSGISSELTRWAVGLAYRPSPGIVIKIEYDFNREKDLSLKNDVLLGQVAVQW
ncbi:MAG: porin [Clostridiales bacterium]|nr:porin [Clostridiales bacterium]